MKGLLCFIVLLVSLFCLCAAKPKPQSQPAPEVQLLRYRNDAEADAIIRSVIAQFEQLGGTSEYHRIQTPYSQPNQVRAFQ